MSVQLNHTIVSCRDQKRSAAFLTGILGLPPATRFGHFLVVQADNAVSLDFAETSGEITAQHYAFLVGEAEFDAAFGRIRGQDLPYWADPGRRQPGVINTRDGGRGVYFQDPDGHLLELLTRPYGSGLSTTFSGRVGLPADTTRRFRRRVLGSCRQVTDVVVTMRLRGALGPSRAGSVRNNRHISCIGEHTGTAGDPVTAGKAEMNMTAHAHDGVAPVTASRRRRADAGAVRLSQRDIDGLLLCGEHGGAPFDLLAAALRVEPDRLPALTARWRRAGYAATGRLGPGPRWCWLTRDGMTATGLGFPATRPALGRLAHLRAILAARLWLQASSAWNDGRAWWHSERRLRADRPAEGRREHVPDAEIHWPSIEASPYAGQVWVVEVELTPKPLERTIRIMAGLLSPLRYAQVIYLTAPPARHVVTRAAGSLPPGEQARIVVRELPASAFTPEATP